MYKHYVKIFLKNACMLYMSEVSFGLIELLNIKRNFFLFIKTRIWHIERFELPKPTSGPYARGNVRSQKSAKPLKLIPYTYVLDAVVFSFIFMVPSVIKRVAVERQTGIKVDMKC
jgi:hypothetical protein